MSSGYLELFVEQGEDYSVTITLDSLNGDPYTLANTSVKSDIRKSYWSENITAQFSANVANPSLGTINLSLSANTTQNIIAGRYVYDVFITQTQSEITNRSKVLQGIVHVEPSATKI